MNELYVWDFVTSATLIVLLSTILILMLIFGIISLVKSAKEKNRIRKIVSKLEDK